ncbi:MAG: YicC family protein [Clostridia bacterium]|nr:YicC family protein [Clostridia bacterium]
MYSMTGYGKGDYRKDGIELTVEVKSVNNRFLDLTVKSPRVFACYEDLIRSYVRESITRGHVDVFVSFTDKRERNKNFFVDLGVAKAYEAAAKTLKSELNGVKDDLTLSFYLRLPDVVKQEDAEGEDEELKNALVVALQSALDNLLKMRLAEGERLKTDLLSRVETVSALREEIKTRAPLVAEEYRKKMTERIHELVGSGADEARILTEAAVFSDKCNIDEELTRLSSHIAEFYSITKEKLIGRKLDFLIQEFNRECNTICSKSNDSEVTRSALMMKNEIEKIREQIQNIE